MDYSRYDLIPFGPFLEEWKEIQGFEGFYEVSNYGRIKNIQNNKIWDGFNHGGYRFIECSSKDKIRRFRIHVLVGKYFVENPENKPFINHIRGFKDDNTFTQIEWVTKAENNRHAYKYLKIPMPFKVEKGKQWKSKTVKRTCLITGEIKIYDYCELVKIDGFDPKLVSGAAMGKRVYKKSKSKWEYLEKTLSK